MRPSTGVCFIGFAEPDEALLGDLRRRFPRATLIADDADLAATVRAVLDFLDEPAEGLALPLDLRGTAFQVRVWEALRRIPPGETRSYAELAAMIGAPRAVRAVARSCATNPVVARRALPSRDRQRRRPDRLSLGRAAQGGAAGPRGAEGAHVKRRLRRAVAMFGTDRAGAAGGAAGRHAVRACG